MVQKPGTKSRSGPVSKPEMPALPSNCYRTPHGYIFRVVVPESLRAAIGKREIKKSLGKDYRQAVSQARLLALQVDKQLADLRDQCAQQRRAMDGLDAYLEVKPGKRHLEPITKVTPERVAGLKSLWLAGLRPPRTTPVRPSGGAAQAGNPPLRAAWEPAPRLIVANYGYLVGGKHVSVA